jgi:CheY-like chemotaxis protein
MKLLIADDDRISRLLLRTILNRLPNCTIVEAADGNAVWEMLNQPPLPEVCILDNIMPGLTGLALLERIRSEPKLMRLPVIICSSSRELDCIERAARLRARHYILKPYQAQLVLDNVRALLRETESRQALDDADEVCQRLGIVRDDYGDLLTALVAELGPGLARISAALGDGALPTALIEANALRGACANLGARLMVDGFTRMEEALRDALGSPNHRSPGHQIRCDQVPRLVGILDYLRYECQSLARTNEQRLQPPASGNVPLSPEALPATVALA